MCSTTNMTNFKKQQLSSTMKLSKIGISPIASCHFCNQQIKSEKVVYFTKCSHLFHLQCASNFLGSSSSSSIVNNNSSSAAASAGDDSKSSFGCCYICSTFTPIKQIKMKKHRKLSIPLSNLTPIPEDSDLIHLKYPVDQYEKICHSRIRSSLSSTKVSRKSPTVVLQFVVKLYHFSSSLIKKQPDVSIHYLTYALWLLTNVQTVSPESKNAVNDAMEVVKNRMEIAREAYVQAFNH